MAKENMKETTKTETKEVMKRGRPKGRSNDTRSFGPLGDLIRKHRIERNLGLSDVAKACDCSVQFISNIEHGRAPLPWDKAQQLARYLEIPLEELQATNLASRSDFKSFFSVSSGVGLRTRKSAILAKTNGNVGVKDAASLVALAAKDSQLRYIIQQYQSSPLPQRKRLYQAARKMA